MSERTLADRLFTNRAPAIFATAREAVARIAELEASLSQIDQNYRAQAQVSADLNEGLIKAAARIAELEAEVARAQKIERLALVQVKETTALLDHQRARIAELEAEVERVEEQRAEDRRGYDA